MTNFFITDKNGTKHAVNEQQLQTLAAKGKILPTTPLEAEGGHTGFAGQIPGLFATAPSTFVQPAPVAPQSVPTVVEHHRGSSWQVTFIGAVLIAVVGGIGWSIINSQQPEQPNNAHVPLVVDAQAPPIEDAQVVPIGNAQIADVQVPAPPVNAVSAPPVTNVPTPPVGNTQAAASSRHDQPPASEPPASARPAPSPPTPVRPATTTPQSSNPARPAMPENIRTRQDCINAILSKIDDANYRNTVFQWLRVCDDLEYDRVNRRIRAVKKYPSGFSSSRMSFIHPVISVFPFNGDGEMWAGFSVVTCDRSGLFPRDIQIADRNGQVLRVSERSWSHNTNIANSNLWVCESDTFGFPNDFTTEQVDLVADAMIRNNECIIRINGSKGYRDIPISSAKAQEFRVFYEAYKVLKKYYVEMK